MFYPEGSDKPTLRMSIDTMTPGKEHTAAILVWSPGSTKTRVTHDFLTNQPVSGGNCGIKPNEGKGFCNCYHVTLKYILIPIV